MDAIQQRNRKLGERTAAALRERHFEAWFCPTAAEAADQILSLIPEGHTVSWGGSKSLEQLGVPDRVKGAFAVIDRDTAVNPAEGEQLRRAGLLADTFLMGTNALTEDGQLFNIDGMGNRVAALCYGPKNVIVVAGINKIVRSEAEAFARARFLAAPINAQRFPVSAPCKTDGVCHNCKAPDSICAQMVATRLCRPAGRIKVVICGEPLGF